MRWKKVISDWKEGANLPCYPRNIRKQFFWETSYIDKEMKEEYDEKFIESERLEQQEYNPEAFLEYIENSDNDYVTSFPNLKKDSMLVIPIPRSSNFTSLKFFMDFSSDRQYRYFWRRVAEEIENMLLEHEGVWVSTHGLGVPYLHVRIDTYPKYYQTRRFK